MSLSRARRLSFQNLERREVMSTMVLESEPNNRKSQSDVVQLDSVDQSAQVQGNIASRRDEDFFRYRPATSGRLALSLTDSPTLAAKISVEDVTGRKLFESEPKNGVTSGDFELVANREIFIRIRGQNRSTGEYSISLTLNAPPASPSDGSTPLAPASSIVNEVESNDSKARANRVALESVGTTQIQGTSQSSNDKDFYAVTPTTSGILRVQVTSTGAGVAKLTVENAAGRKYFETEPNDGVDGGSFAVTAGTTYYFRLRSADPQIAPYLVDLAMA